MKATIIQPLANAYDFTTRGTIHNGDLYLYYDSTDGSIWINDKYINIDEAFS